jgi:hypothetical protein
MLMKKPSYRVFDYTPRYYNPDKDEKEKRKKRLLFRYKRQFNRRVRSPFYWIIIFIIILFFYLKFSK